jgi:cytochrome c-type biogenesis protein CcmF
MYAFVVLDFSVSSVANSHSGRFIAVQKFQGVWGNHEGSMLLWLAYIGAVLALVPVTRATRPGPVLAVQAAVKVAFTPYHFFYIELGLNVLAFALDHATQNPFRYKTPVWRFIRHFVFGYVGLSMSFSFFAIAALLEGWSMRSALLRARGLWLRGFSRTIGIALGLAGVFMNWVGAAFGSGIR